MARNRDEEEVVKLGARVEAKVASMTAVVAVRISADLLARVNAYAMKRQLTVSEVFRQGADQLVSETFGGGPFHVTGATVIGPNIVTGLSTSGTGRSLTRNEAKPELRMTAGV